MKNKKGVQPLVKTEPGEKWYETTYNEKLKPNEEVSSDVLAEYDAKATELFNRDCQLSSSTQQKSQLNVAWISQIIKSGTSADKMSAIQLNAQMDPIHSLQNVRFLITWLQKKVLREVIPVLTALKDVFVDELLPPNRKLIYFKNRPLSQLPNLTKNNQVLLDKRLILWKYESELKKAYEEFVLALESVCSSPVEAVVIHGCKVMKELLSKRPEQEQLLLSFLTNKLCHNKKIVGAKVADHLYELVEEHPNMRLIVATEVEKVMFRKNVPMKAQLYAVHFLSRIIFNANDADLAMKLLQIYFALFKILVQSEEENNKILPIVMTGAHRAIPYAKDRIKELMPEIDSLYKIVYLEKFSIALSALKVLFKILTFNQELSDRFYASFYRRLLTVKTSNHDVEFFALLEKVIMADEIKERVKAFLKRILQIALSSTAAFAGASLLMYSRVIQSKGQDLMILTIEKPKKLKGKKKKLLTDNSDDEEIYVDVDKMEEDQKPSNLSKLKNGKLKVEPKKELTKGKGMKKEVLMGNNTKGWLHRHQSSTKKVGSETVGYDHQARNPLFAKADQSVDSELYLLSQHFHPSVAIFAQTIMDGKPIDYKGDPLDDYSLVRFLDRFAFKNPKTKKERHSIFERDYEIQGIKAIGVKSNDYLNRKIEDIPIDERYLHRFAVKKLKQKDDEFDEVASVNSDEFDVIMDRFEPGEANEEFDVDFSELFGPEKTKDDKKSKKKRKHESDDELDSDAPDEEGDLLQDLPVSDDEEDDSDDDVEDDAFVYSDDGEDDDLLNGEVADEEEMDDDDDDNAEDEDDFEE